MDRLWFQKIILFSERTAAPKTLEQPQLMTTESSACPSPSSSISLATPPNKELLPSTSVLMLEDLQISTAGRLPTTTLPGGSRRNEEEEEDDKDINQKERPTRLNLKTSRARSHSSTPSTQKHPKSTGRSGSLAILPMSVSCRSLGELEIEEVKGFMDLGFIFKKEYLNPRMMCVVPGLQRLGLCRNKQNTNLRDSEVAEDHDGLTREEEEEELKGAIKPYLSEAWLIKRPNLPLLNLRVPRISAATDMKKHLMFWARTVASEIQQK